MDLCDIDISGLWCVEETVIKCERVAGKDDIEDRELLQNRHVQGSYAVCWISCNRHCAFGAVQKVQGF